MSDVSGLYPASMQPFLLTAHEGRDSIVTSLDSVTVRPFLLCWRRMIGDGGIDGATAVPAAVIQPTMASSHGSPPPGHFLPCRDWGWWHQQHHQPLQPSPPYGLPLLCINGTTREPPAAVLPPIIASHSFPLAPLKRSSPLPSQHQNILFYYCFFCCGFICFSINYCYYFDVLCEERGEGAYCVCVLFFQFYV